MHKIATFVLLVALMATPLFATGGRTPIFTQTTITQSGSYFLSQDISVSSGTAIVIDADEVSIDFNGHSLFLDSVVDGISADGQKNLVIENGSIVGGNQALLIQSSTDVTVRNMSITGSSLGINMLVVDSANLSDLNISDSDFEAIHFFDVSDSTVFRVNGSRNEIGIAINDSELISIKHCAFYSNNQDGISLFNSDHNTIDKNVSSGNGVTGTGRGLLINATSDNNIYSGNRFAGNATAGVTDNGTGNVDAGGNATS